MGQIVRHKQQSTGEDCSRRAKIKHALYRVDSKLGAHRQTGAPCDQGRPENICQFAQTGLPR